MYKTRAVLVHLITPAPTRLLIPLFTTFTGAILSLCTILIRLVDMNGLNSCSDDAT